MKIMIVEDEKHIREDLQLLLQAASYEVVSPDAFDDILSRVRIETPDLILLDVRLPGQDGWEICRQIRQDMDVPIIFVTSNDGITSEINGMLLGADDYIAKPYHPSLLLARIAAVLKRAGNHQTKNTYEHKGVTLDIRTYKLSCGNARTELSKNECKLLSYLMQHQGEVVPRMELMDYLWDNEVFIDDSALSVNVTRIRKKLEELGVTDYIETKRGVGYRV